MAIRLLHRVRANLVVFVLGMFVALAITVPVLVMLALDDDAPETDVTQAARALPTAPANAAADLGAPLASGSPYASLQTVGRQWDVPQDAGRPKRYDLFCPEGAKNLLHFAAVIDPPSEEGFTAYETATAGGGGSEVFYSLFGFGVVEPAGVEFVPFNIKSPSKMYAYLVCSINTNDVPGQPANGVN